MDEKKKEILDCINEMIYSSPHSAMQIEEQLIQLKNKIATFFYDHICLEQQKVKEQIIIHRISDIDLDGVSMGFSLRFRSHFKMPNTQKERDEVKEYLLTQFVCGMEENVNKYGGIKDE